MSTNWPRMALAGTAGVVAFVGVALIVRLESRVTELEVQMSILEHGKRGARAGRPERRDLPPPPEDLDDGPPEGPPDDAHDGPPEGPRADGPRTGKGGKRRGLGSLPAPGSVGPSSRAGEPSPRALRVEAAVLDFIDAYEIDEDRADELVAVYGNVSDTLASVRARRAAGELDDVGATRARQAVREATQARLNDLLDADEREALMLEVQEAAEDGG
jgi:hypothetical protein